MSDTSPIYGAMKRHSLLDFPGRMAAVLFTTGCNFRCGFCHNAVLLGKPRRGYTWEQLDAMCSGYKKNWVDAVVISGGEPTLHATLPRTVDFFRERGFAVKLDTNGSRPEVLEALLPKLDYVAMDIKCSPAFYQDFVGFGDTAAVEHSVRLLIDGATPYEFRTTVIEDIHHPEEIRAMGEMVKGADTFVVQAFIPRDDLPDPALSTKPRTSPQVLARTADIMKHYVAKVDIRGA